MADKKQTELGLNDKKKKKKPTKKSAAAAALKGRGEGELMQLVDQNFLEYASYVIRDRAIPHLDDGLKPVQRRIMHSLKKRDDGKFIKVANIVGYCMQFHPHGDASIAAALVNLTNKRYLIEPQGNFGNVLTGDPPAASRYIECRLTDLARNEIFNKQLTEFIPSYDGRNQEPVTLPCKLPLLLMLGAEGIAVGLATRILPHNFIELLEQMKRHVQKKPLEVIYPDFIQGGVMDPADYDDGRGRVKVRAVIDKKDKSTLVIREVPHGTTTESLIASIEKVARSKKIKIRAISDYTAEDVEIHVVLSPGEDQDKAMQALYALTDCENSLNSNIMVIHDKRPNEMTVSQVIKHNAVRLKEILGAELELEKARLLDQYHHKTLVQIFCENRIYREIEDEKTYDDVQQAVLLGVNKFKKLLRRKVTIEDVEMLLGIPVRKISLFDIEKSKKEIGDILNALKEVEKNIKGLTRYTTKYIDGLVDKYKNLYPRRTRIDANGFEEISIRDVVSSSFKISYDKASGYIGHAVRGGEGLFNCTALDKVILVWKDGRYMLSPVMDKLFVNKDLIYAALYDRDKQMTMVYTATSMNYIKRFTFGGVIQKKEYRLSPEKSRVVMFSDQPVEKVWVKYKPAPRQRVNQQIFDMENYAVRGAKSKGNQLSSKKIHNAWPHEPRGWTDEELDADAEILDL